MGRNSVWTDPFEGEGGTYPPGLANHSLEEKAESLLDLNKLRKHSVTKNCSGLSLFE